MNRRLRRSVLLLLAAASFTAAPHCPGHPVVYEVALGDFTLAYWWIGSAPYSATQVEHTLEARLRNRGSEADEILVWATSRAPATAMLDGALRFGSVPPGASVPSVDTFRIRQQRGVPFDPEALVWLELDRYGGWKEIAAEATGRFRVQEIDGVWWFITPEGHGLWQAGVTGVEPVGDFSPALGTSPYHDNVLARYGSDAAWARVTEERHRGWNFNVIGGWTSPNLFDDRIPFNAHLAFARWAPVVVPAGQGGAFFRALRDFFDPAWLPRVDEEAARASACSANPWCIGVYSDNELPFGSFIFQALPYLDAYLSLPAGAPGKLAVQAFFEERYAGDVEPFNRVWGQALASFDELQALAALPPVQSSDPTLEPPARLEDRRLFLGRVAERYFQVVHAALRAVDPELLILGARFVPVFTGVDALLASVPYVDVISINDYALGPGAYFVLHLSGGAFYGNLFTQLGAFQGLDALHALAPEKPMLITEWFYRINVPGREFPPTLPGVPSFEARPDVAEAYLDEMIERPFVAGAHWFQYQDQPIEGRFDGENQLIGLVDIRDDPHPELVERLTRVNGAIPLRRAELAR